MPHEMRMPSLGQTTDELRIVAWLKSEGERVAFGEPLLEVETDKAVLDVESAVAGTLLRILHDADEVVLAGALIAYIGTPDEAPPPSANTSVSHAADAAAARLAEIQAVPVQTPPAVRSDKVLATPTARQMAKELGVDIRQVVGSGPQGRIEKRDVASHGALQAPHARGANATQAQAVTVQAAAQTASVHVQTAAQTAQQPAQPTTSEPPATPRSTPDADGEQPVPRHRVVIAQRLLRSVQSMPQITVAISVDMSRARLLLSQQRKQGTTALTYTHLILRAMARALREHPRLNRVWLADGPRYRHYARADVAVAVASADNLLVVTVPEPDRLSLAQLADYVIAAAERGRRAALAQADLAPAAMTLSNLGMHGVDEFQAIVDPDQAGILACGRVVEQTAVVNGGIYVVPMMRLNLTVDHRIADGVAAATFLGSVRADLEAGAP